MVEGNLDTIIDNPTEVIQQLQEADHFYICHYSKKREQIEHRRCFWDSKSKIWTMSEKSQERLLVLAIILVGLYYPTRAVLWWGFGI